ncbi:MAG: aminoglycoside phosphotransferase family protein, partial [Clostridia bacterium]|nr:aminoglycoside phosphotransferase family protein [Clostridia bacterium]
LNDFDATELIEVIPNFHDTKKRFEDFKKSVEKDSAFRVKDVQEDIKFVLDRENIVSTIVEKIQNGQIPLRVTHNDTKLNNFMFDKDTNEFTCLVDLDTIMPGSLLYDFGDAIRIAASTAGEEERDLTKVKFDLKAYEAFLSGFIKGIGNSITAEEAKLLHISAKIMTFEIGMRFLGDYIDGDRYFKINEEDQNLVRARSQLKMVKEIEDNEKEMENILYKYYNNK